MWPLCFQLPLRATATAIAAALIFTSGSVAAETAVIKTETVRPPGNFQYVTNADPYVGPITAPVTMEIWLDYQCPYCLLLWQDALPRVINKYVASGQLRIVFKDFEFLGTDSVTTALFARAVWDLYPQRFYDWNKAIFGAQGDENGGWARLDHIVELTNNIKGFDGSLLSAQLNANKARYTQAIQADMTEGRSAGVEGTPTILIESRPLDGLYSYENISAAIDKQLATGSAVGKR